MQSRIASQYQYLAQECIYIAKYYVGDPTVRQKLRTMAELWLSFAADELVEATRDLGDDVRLPVVRS
jgi:hypothetical protein